MVLLRRYIEMAWRVENKDYCCLLFPVAGPSCDRVICRNLSMDRGRIDVYVPFPFRNSFKSCYRLSDYTTASGNSLCLPHPSLSFEVSRLDTESLDASAHIFDMDR